MKDAGISKSVCMPISPNVAFENLKEPCRDNPTLVPFTSVDFTNSHDFNTAFDNDVLNGANGMKLHPVIQKVSFEDGKTLNVLEAFSIHKLPVLFHCGAQWNRSQDKKYAEYALPENAIKMVEAFPKINFIIGHAGVYQVKQVMSIFKKFKNTYVDTSFQPAAIIKQLIRVFGPERVLFASDWPFGSRKTNIETVEAACQAIKDQSINSLIFYENAERLLTPC